MTDLHFGIITGLTLEENRQLATLAEVFNYHQPYNETKDKYYEGHITLNDVNIGIALPGEHQKAGGRLQLGPENRGCCWLRAACLTVL